MGGRARRAIGLRRWGEIPFGCVARVQTRAVEREWEGLNPPRSAVGSCTAVGGSRWWPSIGYLCSAIFFCSLRHKKNKPSGMENPARPTVNRLQAFVLGLTRWLELQLPTTSFCGQCLKDLPRRCLATSVPRRCDAPAALRGAVVWRAAPFPGSPRSCLQAGCKTCQVTPGGAFGR